LSLDNSVCISALTMMMMTTDMISDPMIIGIHSAI